MPDTVVPPTIRLTTAAANSLRPTFHKFLPPSLLASKPFSARNASWALVNPTLILPSIIAIVAGVTPCCRRIASHSRGRLMEWGGGRPAGRERSVGEEAGCGEIEGGFFPPTVRNERALEGYNGTTFCLSLNYFGVDVDGERREEGVGRGAPTRSGGRGEGADMRRGNATEGREHL